ncbi:MAG: imidazole glycerol phosphate synthase subunit HisH [Cyanobacteriota bacterium]
MPSIALIDYDLGNLHSAAKGLEKVGATTTITDSAQVIKDADAVVIPGDGAFDPAIKHLQARNLIDPIKSAIAQGKPFLGICLGLQVLFTSSEEGKETGLGIICGTVRQFHPEPNLTIPHMGWNALEFTQPNHPLWQDLPDNPMVYFVHSYYVVPDHPQVSAAMVTHGTQRVTSAIAQDNIMAVQFHPEKSSHIGLKILSNFVRLVDESSLRNITF